MPLKTDYLDYIPSTENRKFTMIDNGDGTYSFVDATIYTQTGDNFGASDMNGTNTAVNLNTTQLGGYYLWVGTQAEYDLITTPSDYTLYFILEE